jgi:hypothetical protein
MNGNCAPEVEVVSTSALLYERFQRTRVVHVLAFAHEMPEEAQGRRLGGRIELCGEQDLSG